MDKEILSLLQLTDLSFKKLYTYVTHIIRV